MSNHHGFTVATGIPIYFCDPALALAARHEREHQRPLRQFLPKGTDLSVHDFDALAAIAERLNHRPRKTLDWDTPAERMAALLDTA